MDLKALTAVSPLLAGLSGQDTVFFESIAHQVELEAGEVLFDEGEAADTFYIISEGRIGLEMTSPGRRPMAIQTLGKGDLVGLSWFFPSSRWNWRARAVVGTMLAAFDADAVRRRCEAEPDLARRILEVIARETATRLHRTRIQLLDLYGRPAS
ncbi:MAG TPA: cyclic nucleotide-binding domain-containing protein [Acidimicrobiia bacterium]|nr:cyclic nucleotide-binding domain-containing protein [Acidimicrobiia bacterium]